MFGQVRKSVPTPQYTVVFHLAEDQIQHAVNFGWEKHTLSSLLKTALL